MVVSNRDPIRVILPREIHYAGGAGYVITGRFAAKQHCSGIMHFLMIEARAEPIDEGIAAKVAPEVSAATQIFPVPIDLRIIPQLMTDRAQILPSVDLLVFLPSGGTLPRLRSDELPVTNRRQLRIPTDLCVETHPKPDSDFPRRGDLMLVVPEDHELPCELWKLRSILSFEMINLLNVLDDVIEIPANAIHSVSFGTGAIDRAGNVSDSIFHQSFEQLIRGMIEVDAVRERDGNRFGARIFQNS